VAKLRHPEGQCTVLIAGVNTGLTRDRSHKLKDGAACILRDGEVLVAVAEERITRKKHDGGFGSALQYCLSSAGLKLQDLDMLVVSTCAEEPLQDGCNLGIPINPTKIRAMPSHHLSHAYSAFMTSPFDESVIMILDNEGNMLGHRKDPVYWHNRVERNSYYMGSGDRVELLEIADDGLEDDEIGPGEAYRHFTYFLGWHSYVYAGNTMGLAPYGRDHGYMGLDVFDLKSGNIRCVLHNGGADPCAAVTSLANAARLPVGPPRSPDGPLTPRHADIAALIQHELERALIYKATALARRVKTKNLCIGGGVALNCVAVRKILDNTSFDRVHVGPAPGDSGQCLGNALYGWTKLKGGSRPRTRFSPFLGREYTEGEQLSAVEKESSKLLWTRSTSIAEEAARLLGDGYVLGWFQGRSELGPRALGARSIVADPRQPAMRDFLNIVVKHREPFRPYAPSVLVDEGKEYLDLPQPALCMELTAHVDPAKQSAVPAIVHVDGTCRPQSITGDDKSVFAALVRNFYRQTGTPMILNTSFNLSGEPIVESPQDAVECFMRSKLDYLVMGDLLIRRALDGPAGPLFWKWTSQPDANGD
jgi:carbamoyltransferase